MDCRVRTTPQEREYVIRGDFTAADEDDFFDVFVFIRAQTEKTVVFNLAKCSFIDSAAIGMLLVAFEEGAQRGLNFILRDVPEEIMPELTLAGIGRYFRFQMTKK